MDNTVYEISSEFEDFVPPPRKKRKNKLTGFEMVLAVFVVFLIVANVGIVLYVSSAKTPVKKTNTLLALGLTPTKTVSETQDKLQDKTNKENPPQSKENAIELPESKNGADADDITQTNDQFNNTASATIPKTGSILPTQAPGKIGDASSSNNGSNNSPGSAANASDSTLSVNPTSSPPTPTPIPSSTPTITIAPSQTPVPTISNPPNIGDIVDDPDTYDGTILQVIGYLITGNIGDEACEWLIFCDHSEIILNETPDPGRDPYYDVAVKMRTTEIEENYTVGSKITLMAKVVVVNGVVTLEKQY